ncbi:MAG: LysR family transcriptional regulator [Hyphomicrobiales bacterium]|nr:LysR family transcriptional regulator [Hyphomicrobiales bacterium]
MDRLRAYEVFVAIAGADSLSAAARRLKLPLTTVSRTLAALEARYGVTLVTRTSRHMALTDAGRRLAETARRLLEDVADLDRAFTGGRGELSGELVVTAPVVFGRRHVLPSLAGFMTAHPELSVRLILTDRSIDLAEEGVDLAVRIGPLPDSTLLARRVGRLERVVCAAPAHLDRYGCPARPEELVAHPAVVFEAPRTRSQWEFRSRRHGRATIEMRPRMVVNTADAAVDAAAAGLGVTRILSYQAAPALADGRLVRILDDHDDVEVPIHLVQRSVRHPKAALRAALEHLARDLRVAFPSSAQNRSSGVSKETPFDEDGKGREAIDQPRLASTEKAPAPVKTKARKTKE